MIIPYGHERTVGRVPYVTFGIIAICTLVQLYATFVAPDLEAIQEAMQQARSVEEVQALVSGVDPDSIPILRFGYQADSGWNLNLIASAFVHSGWLHLVGNMLFLWLAGSALEDRLGHLEYLVFYVVSAVVATLCWDGFRSPDSPELVVGASGAISALLGAFLVYFAGTRVLLWYWIAMRSGTFRMAAYLVLPLWLAEQVLYASLQEGGGVAYSAHIGGFGFGVALALLAKLVGIGREDADSEAIVAPVANPAPYQRCLDAIAARDGGAVRLQASRVILDLARQGDHTRIVELYTQIARTLTQVPLTDGAFLAAAKAADAINNQRVYVEILETALREQPGSRLAPEFQARLNRR